MSIIISNGTLIALVAMLVINIIIQAIDTALNIRLFKVIRQKSDKPYDALPRDIAKLHHESEIALYEKCINKILSAKDSGKFNCYLVTGSKAPLPRWITEKLLKYGFDISVNYYDQKYYKYIAYWDKDASGKMRPYEMI